MTMDEWAIIMIVDAEAGELILYDSGDRALMEAAFVKLVTDSKEEADFFLVKVVKSAEHVLNVVDHGDVT